VATLTRCPIRRVTWCLAVVTATSCANETGPADVGPPGLRLVAGAGVEDTITAVLPQALVVEVRDESGRALPHVEMRVAAASPGGIPNVAVASVTSLFFQWLLVDTTDARGRVVLLVRLGGKPGPATLAIAAPALGLQATATYTVREGAPAKVEAQPADTALYVGSTYALRGVVEDRLGNPRAEAVDYAIPAGGQVVSENGANVRGERIGRGYVVARFGAIVDTVRVSVVPQGLIAAYEPPIYYNSDGLDVRQAPRIVLLQLDGSGFRVLYEQSPPEIPFGYGDGLLPRWSPAGDQIAFVSWGELWTVDPLGVTRRLHAGSPSVSRDYAPEYSPDGQWIYVTQTTDSTGIWRVRTDGSSIEKTAAQWPGAASPSPAPTGDRVAYQKQGALAILDLPSDTTAILPVPGQYPRWSPTGEWIAYLDDANRVRVVRPDGTDRRLVGTGVAAHTAYSWSPDGQWLIFSGSQATPSDQFAVGLSLVNVASGEVLPLHFSHRLVQPSWHR